MLKARAGYRVAHSRKTQSDCCRQSGSPHSSRAGGGRQSVCYSDEDREVDQDRIGQSGRQVSQAGQGQSRAELIEDRAG
jgi:hypothetical protein